MTYKDLTLTTSGLMSILHSVEDEFSRRVGYLMAFDLFNEDPKLLVSHYGDGIDEKEWGRYLSSVGQIQVSFASDQGTVARVELHANYRQMLPEPLVESGERLVRNFIQDRYLDRNGKNSRVADLMNSIAVTVNNFAPTMRRISHK